MELRSVFTYCRLFLCDVISQDVPIVSAVCSDVHACEPTKFTRSLIIGLNSFSFLCCITSCISSALNLHSLLMYASRSSSFQEYTYINQVFIYEVSKQHEYRNYIPYMVFSYYINSTYIALHFTLVYSSDLLSILQWSDHCHLWEDNSNTNQFVTDGVHLESCFFPNQYLHAGRVRHSAKAYNDGRYVNELRFVIPMSTNNDGVRVNRG